MSVDSCPTMTAKLLTVEQRMAPSVAQLTVENLNAVADDIASLLDVVQQLKGKV